MATKYFASGKGFVPERNPQMVPRDVYEDDEVVSEEKTLVFEGGTVYVPDGTHIVSPREARALVPHDAPSSTPFMDIIAFREDIIEAHERGDLDDDDLDDLENILGY